MDLDFSSNLNVILASQAATISFLTYVSSCVVGQIGNAIWLWLGKEIDCVFDRFRHDPRATIKALVVNFGVVFSVAIVIPFDGLNWKAALILGLMQGLSADSKLNASARKIWTEEERAAKK